MLGEKLMKLRKRRGMSQQEVADLLGVTRQTVSNWEGGQGAPALDKASELARCYGVRLDDLVADEVEVVTAAEPTPSKDLHVLRGLQGRACQLMPKSPEDMLSGMDDLGRMRTMRILEVDEGWLRVEYERAQGIGKKERVVQLIDVDAIDSITVVEEAS